MWPFGPDLIVFQQVVAQFLGWAFNLHGAYDTPNGRSCQLINPIDLLIIPVTVNGNQAI